MTTAKKKTVKKKTAKKKTVSEKTPASNNIDMVKLTAEITDTVMQELATQFEQKLNSAVSTLRQTSEVQQNRIAMSKGEHKYSVTADEDGLQFCRGDNTVLLIGKNGQLGVGTRAPRSHGKGSAHIRAGGPSEATLPTNGDFSTRGLIVEGDGDDDLSYSLRAVSRMNRQGFNVFSDGAVSVGSMKKLGDSTFSIYHREPEKTGAVIHSPSKNYDNTLVQIESASPQSDYWNALEVVSEADNFKTVVHRVNGQGDVFASGAYYTNPTGYAEMFEWADGNHRGEDRTGFTVAINAEGKLVVANEGDAVVGVIVPHAALIANSQWNHWKNKYFQDQFGRKTQGKYQVVEWLETETTILNSHFAHSLASTFALPENAVITETDADGNDLSTSMVNSAHNSQEKYQGRQKRDSWAAVCLLGTVTVFKGQAVEKSWIKIKSVNDELDLMLIR